MSCAVCIQGERETYHSNLKSPLSRLEYSRFVYISQDFHNQMWQCHSECPEYFYMSSCFSWCVSLSLIGKAWFVIQVLPLTLMPNLNLDLDMEFKRVLYSWTIFEVTNQGTTQRFHGSLVQSFARSARLIFMSTCLFQRSSLSKITTKYFTSWEIWKVIPSALED